MEYRTLGQTGVDVSVVVLGAWQYGKAGWGEINDDESIATIQAALDGGINMIDTAVGYGSGYSEEIVGRAVAGRRDEVLLASKCGAQPDHIRTALDDCLKRMGLDCIDLYQVHYPSPSIPIEDTIGAMAEIQQAGKIRWIGVSNFDLEQMGVAVETARIETCQPPFNVFWRQIDDDVLPFCVDNEIAVLPYSPLAQGLLAGKYTSTDEAPPADDIRFHNKLFDPPIMGQCLEVVERIREIGAKYGKTVVQTALAWTIHYPGITAPVIGARRPSQLQENLGATDFYLDHDEMEEISTLGWHISQQLDFDSNMWGYAPT